MTVNSRFESRTGKLSCSSEELFAFITDIRNLEQFIPPNSISGWKADPENCSFRIQPLGSASITISDKIPVKKVVFSGNALQNNYFTLQVQITENEESKCEVKLFLDAEMNPVLKMMASGPMEQLLEKLVGEMEKYTGWNLKFKEN